MMQSDEIVEIGIGKDNRLYACLKNEQMNQIYRAAMEVNWDEQKNALYCIPRGEWTYKEWFSQILNAALDEYGFILKLSDDVRWTNVPEDLKTQIKEIAKTFVSNKKEN